MFNVFKTKDEELAEYKPNEMKKEEATADGLSDFDAS